MKSNYKRIGDYIREVTVRNKDLSVNSLMGINIDKYFMPSVANTIGTDMSKYKIVKKGQFACNRMHVGRDKRLPIALLKDYESIIVSPAYTVFEIIDEEILNPEYLMMWFSRSEFDREAWFYTDSDVRGGLSLEDFFNINIPIPSIEKQREIVKEYNTILNRIKLNQNIIEKLQDLAQSIYNQWFEEFQFPNDSNENYKSSGGEMKYSKELNKLIPVEWECKSLGELTEEICVGFVGTVFDDYCDKEDGILMLRTTNLSKQGINYNDLKYVTKKFHNKNKKSQIQKGDILVARHGNNGLSSIFDESFEANCLNVIIIKPNEKIMTSKAIHCFLNTEYSKIYFKESVGGSVQNVLNTKKISEIKLAYPNNNKIINKLFKILEEIQNSIEIRSKINRGLGKVKNIILLKISRVGDE